MLFKNINYLLRKRQAQQLGASQFRSLDPESLWTLIESLGVPFERLNTVDLERSDEHLRNGTIKLLVLDVDGVFTEGGMYYNSEGQEMKRFNVKDGLGIQLAMKAGVEIGIISAALRSEVTAHRAQMLGIKRIYIGVRPKLEVLNEWLKEMRLDLNHVAYIGDDINDLPILEKVGFSASPQDAHSKVKAVVNVVLSTKGGEGCIREFIDHYIILN